MSFSFTLYGTPITKKNSQRICFNKATGRSFIKASAQYEKYERDCIKQLWKIFNSTPNAQYEWPISKPCTVTCVYYMPTKRKVDLTNLLEGTHDILVGKKKPKQISESIRVLEDDNCSVIVSVDGSRVLYDKENPRVEITISDYLE